MGTREECWARVDSSTWGMRSGINVSLLACEMVGGQRWGLGEAGPVSEFVG